MKRSLIFPLAALLCATVLAAPAAGSKLAGAATKAHHFMLVTRATVSYGYGTTWTDRTFDAGTYACNAGTFGLPSAAATAGEQCKFTLKGGGVVVVAPPVAALAVIASEDGPFTLTAPTPVTFGLNDKTVSKTLPAGAYTCNRALFGSDPAGGVAKTCSTAGSMAVTPRAVEKPSTGSITDPAEYRRVAALMGTNAGVDYLYGTTAGKVPTNSYFGPRPSKSARETSVQNPNGKGTRGCGYGEGSWCGTWQLGPRLQYESGDYSSNVLNYAYIPAATWDRTKFKAPAYYGVGSLSQSAIGNGTASVVPEVSWNTFEGEARNNSHNEEQAMKQREGKNLPGTNGADIFEGKPVALARGYGRGGWVTNVLFVQSNGYVTSHGSATSRNPVKIKLPAGQTPTAIAVTNSGEFALVTTWDTAAVKGKVWFIAMKDGCAFCSESNEAGWDRNWGFWRQVYPGLPNGGNYIGGKILGSVDLPDDIKAPTGISVTTGRKPGRDGGYDTVMHPWDEPINTAAQRARYYNGNFSGAIPNTGVAVVVSKGEKRAAFINLEPLFRQFREQYFAPMSDAEFAAKMANRGDGDTQFPPTFVGAPSQKPTVIKTVALPSAPTAVKITREAPYRALIGTEAGDVRVWDMSATYLNQTNGKAGGQPGDIKELFTYPVGANITSIAYVKGKSSQRQDGKRALYDYAKDEDYIWALSRGEKKALMLKWNVRRTGFSTFMTLSDSRMTDPIALEDADNHGTESYVMSVVNNDPGQTTSGILNYLYGPLIMYTYHEFDPAPCQESAPCGPAKGSIEFAGEYKIPGKAFAAAGANVN